MAKAAKKTASGTEKNVVKKTAIVLTAHGTHTAASDTYDFFEAQLRKSRPDCEVFWAFSSKAIRKKTASQKNALQSPAQVLKNLKKKEYQRVVVQSLHVVPGIEFEKLVSAAEAFNMPVTVGKPLLSSEIDCHRTIDALADGVPDTEQTSTVMVGHGTPHSGAGAMYMQFEACLKSRYPKNVYVSMVEGVPTWEATCAAVRQSGLKKVSFIPLMFVAGHHIRYDVMGRHRDAWKNDLEGFDISVLETGLGFNEKIIDIYADHLKEALEKR